MKKSFTTFIILLCTLFLVSCDDTLTREEAKEQIVAKLGFPFDEIKTFTVNDNTYYANKTAEKYQLLKEIGFLDYTFQGQYASDYHAKTFLTDKGKQFVVSGVRNQGFFDEVDVKVAKIEFGEITGIQEIKFGEVISYFVEYTICRKQITPFGKIVHDLNEKTIHKKVKFTKYDDGWRVNDSSLKDLKETLIFNFDNAENFNW